MERAVANTTLITRSTFLNLLANSHIATLDTFG